VQNRRSIPIAAGLIALAALQLGCPKAQPSTIGVTSDVHTWFDISMGSKHELGSQIADGTIGCQSCHPANANTFTQFTCLGCHAHELAATERSHLTVSDYKYGDSNACYSCHTPDKKTTFDHGGIANACAMCHDQGAAFARLPKAGFTHPKTGNVDCGGCHNTMQWKDALGPSSAHDPAHDLSLTGLLPTFGGTLIVNMTSQSETLSMVMNHSSPQAPASIITDCKSCHPNIDRTSYFPGTFHASLTAKGVAQPALCVSCHAATTPVGFVGQTATSPARVPASGEMRHDAVLWANGLTTNNPIVTADCSVCHRVAAGGQNVTWATGKTTSTVQYHASLTAANAEQPSQCVDCHANTRPQGVLTGSNAALPAGVALNHGDGAALGDCSACHAASGPSWTSWRGGKFHLATSANPPTCLPCHSGERPTSTASWTSTTYKSSPFDYTTNVSGSTHGDGQDCVFCHEGPGTGAWGGTQNWIGGFFDHGSGSHADATCAACHATQRPDVQPGTTAAAMATLLGFDHSINGTGDCIGCHAATRAAKTYVNYMNPSTHALPGGDWKGGVSYPGASLASSLDQFINVTETRLIHDESTTNVVASTTVTDTIYNSMLHVSTVLPAPLAAGPPNAPDNSKCWHCHTNNNGTVTAFRNGQFHTALTNYRATPTGPVVPFPQPTSQCKDCHSAMVPDGVVEGATDPSLWPMDHEAMLATPIMVGSLTVNGVSDLDCSVCHTDPGGSWLGAGFHYNIPSTAVAADCGVCHYMTMADPIADTISGTAFAMKHESSQLGAQKCPTCHTGAKAVRSQLPATWQLWSPATYHATVNMQPLSCVDCHLVSLPAAGAPTQSAISYTFNAGGTATNAAQWMNHGSSQVVGKDCVACHAGDATATVTAWSKSTSLHAGGRTPTTCQECHGLTNGGGTAPGDRNNLPAGLTNSTTPTSASSATGIPAGTLSQITHADINVSSRDCGSCHTQLGAAPSGALKGMEWAQAQFHANFLTATALVLNGTTGRCSNCHMSDTPKSTYRTFNHAGLSSASGTRDCSACHTYPGTGTVASPNWLGGSMTPTN
jgi:hypothetical protein